LPGPTLTFGFILATLYGAMFHFMLGGDMRRLALYLLASWIGFALGQVIGGTLGISLLSIGSLYILPATLGAVIALVMAYFLTARRTTNRSR